MSWDRLLCRISGLLIRASETEPLIGIYGESVSDEMVQQLLLQGLELLRTVARPT
ncbi:MAG: hypothetical protein PVF15_09640 [Candidatus Bathyarchaeota archaeon]